MSDGVLWWHWKYSHSRNRHLGAMVDEKASGRVEELKLEGKKNAGVTSAGAWIVILMTRLPYRGFPTNRLPRRLTIPFQLHNPVQVCCRETNHLNGDLYVDIFISSKWIFLIVIFRVTGVFHY